MKAILILVLLATTAAAEPVTQSSAIAQVAMTRAKWDAAVAGGHPVEAGVWARRHFVAVQRARAAGWHTHQASKPVLGPVTVRSPLAVRTRL